MEFQKTEVVIKTPHGDQTIEATQGVGTGLAYHHVWINGELDTSIHTLIHVTAGYDLCSLAVTQEEEAQAWLEKVSSIYPHQWNCSAEDLGLQQPETAQRVRALIERAHYDASRDDYFLYAASTRTIYEESATDAPTRNPESALIQAIANDLLRGYRSASRVVFTKMTPDGRHHDIRVFEREQKRPVTKV